MLSQSTITLLSIDDEGYQETVCIYETILQNMFIRTLLNILQYMCVPDQGYSKNASFALTSKSAQKKTTTLFCILANIDYVISILFHTIPYNICCTIYVYEEQFEDSEALIRSLLKSKDRQYNSQRKGTKRKQ